MSNDHDYDDDRDCKPYGGHAPFSKGSDTSRVDWRAKAEALHAAATNLYAAIANLDAADYAMTNPDHPLGRAAEEIERVLGITAKGDAEEGDPTCTEPGCRRAVHAHGWPCAAHSAGEAAGESTDA